MSAGRLRDRVSFERSTNEPDPYGGFEQGWDAIAAIGDVRGHLKVERGPEKIEAGRGEAPLQGTLRVRSSEATRTLTAADRAVINGETWGIISAPANPDRRDRFVEMVVERGGAAADA